MEELLLRRFFSTKDRNLGILMGDDEVLPLFTLELPNLNNQNNISCIPAGKYKLTRYNSPSKGACLLIHDVPERENILIHVGNTPKDTKGCILVGMGIYKQDLVDSKIAFDKLLYSYFGYKDFVMLNIKDNL